MMNKSLIVLLVLVSFIACGGKLWAASQGRLVIVPEKAEVAPLGTLKFKALVMDAKGQSQQPTRVSWRSDGGDIDRDGNFRAPNEICTVVVMAMVDDLHAWVRVSVKKQVTDRKKVAKKDVAKTAEKLKAAEKLKTAEKLKAAEKPRAAEKLKAAAEPNRGHKVKTESALKRPNERDLLRRLAQQERRIAIQEKWLSQQERRIAQQERRFALQERRIALQERKFAQQERKFAQQERRFAVHERRFDLQKKGRTTMGESKRLGELAQQNKAVEQHKVVKQRKAVDRNFVFQRQIMDVLGWHVSRVDKKVRKLEAIVRVEHPAAKKLEVFALCSRRLVRRIKTIKVRTARTVKLTAQFEANNVRRLGVRLISGKGEYLAATTRDFSR